MKTRSDNSSGTTGVSWDEHLHKWSAYINYDGKKHRLGSFNELVDAINARKNKENEVFGEFSYDNSMKYSYGNIAT